MLKIGDLAPSFSLPDQNGEFVSLSDFLGQRSVVIFFYPKDFTPGCTAESCSFRDRNDEFARFNAQILGVSQDDASSHQNFIAKHDLPYPLLTDAKNVVASQFGVEKTFGLFAGRASFVIDPQGIIQMAFSSQLSIQKHVDSALEVVKRLSSEALQS